MSDNGPQFSAATFSKFVDEWGFTHLTSSPYYPQSNGEAAGSKDHKESICQI
jgi:transposase InsO family protein